MKEDAQLICPISYHDPSGVVWAALQQNIVERLPLRDVSWRTAGTISSSQATVEKLPLRFMPSTASLFKDTDHPFRWFLAPYANIYFVNVDTLEAYKDAKPAIKKWVETLVGLKRASWLLAYAPVFSGIRCPDAVMCSKVYAKLSSEFYAERAGDRTINFTSATIPQFCPEDSLGVAYTEFFSKVKEGIVMSFFQRSAHYDSDIRRLDSFRGSQQFDFRQLFLVKESLALMYQLMQLPQEALRQYGELEALLSVVPVDSLPSNDWPLIVAADLRTSPRGGTPDQNLESETTPPPTSGEDSPAAAAAAVMNQSTGISVGGNTFEYLYSDPLGEGENVLSYSINSARMRILKNKIGLRELRRYLFARQMHFLAQQHKGRECASKGLLYVADTYSNIILELSTVNPVSPIVNPIGNPMGDAKVNAKVSTQRRRQADLWALSAAVKIVRSCRGYLAKQLEHEYEELKCESVALADTAGITSEAAAGVTEVPGGEVTSPMRRKKTRADREAVLLREASLPLGDLLHLAINRLHSLSASFILHPTPSSSSSYTSFTSLSSSSSSSSSSWPSSFPSGGVGSHARTDTRTDGTNAHIEDHGVGRSGHNFYRQQSILLAQSLLSEGVSCSSYDSSKAHNPNPNTPNSITAVKDPTSPLPLISPVPLISPLAALQSITATRNEALSVAVEDALLTDLDKALGSFSIHLRSVLARGTPAPREGPGGVSGGVSPRSPRGEAVGEVSWALWCPLSVLLLRALVSHEELVGRYRIACRSRLDCADVLMCHGYHLFATACYSEVMVIKDRDDKGERGERGERSQETAAKGFEIEGERVWEGVERVALCKILYCAAASKDRIGYMRTAVQLRAMQAQRGAYGMYGIHCDSNGKDNNNSNSSTIAVQGALKSIHIGGDEGAINGVKSEGERQPGDTHPLNKHFQVLSAVLMQGDIPLKCLPTSKMVEVCAGGTYTLEVTIVSLFPCTVQVDDVYVRYQSHLETGTLPPLCDAPLPVSKFLCSTGGTGGSSSDASQAVVNCSDISPSPSLYLTLGVARVFPLSFKAPVESGDYSVCEIGVMVREGKGDGEGEECVTFIERGERRIDDSPPPIAAKESSSVGEKEHSSDPPSGAIKGYKGSKGIKGVKASISSLSPLSYLPSLSVVEHLSPLISDLAGDEQGSHEGGGVCPLGVSVCAPLLMPLTAIKAQLTAIRRAEVTSVREGELIGEKEGEGRGERGDRGDRGDRGFLLQVELSNPSPSAAKLLSVRMCNPHCSQSDLTHPAHTHADTHADNHDGNGSEYRKGDQTLSPLPQCDLHVTLAGCPGSASIQPTDTVIAFSAILISPGDSYCVPLTFLWRAVPATGGPSAPSSSAPSGTDIPSTSDSRATSASMVATTGETDRGEERGNSSSSSSSRGPHLIFTCGSATGSGPRSELLVPLSSSLLALQDMLKSSVGTAPGPLTPRSPRSSVLSPTTDVLEGEEREGDEEEEAPRRKMLIARPPIRRVLTKAILAEEAAMRISLPLDVIPPPMAAQ